MSASSQGRFATGSDRTADIERGRRRATRRHSHGRVCVSSAVRYIGRPAFRMPSIRCSNMSRFLNGRMRRRRSIEKSGAIFMASPTRRGPQRFCPDGHNKTQAGRRNFLKWDAVRVAV